MRKVLAVALTLAISTSAQEVAQRQFPLRYTSAEAASSGSGAAEWQQQQKDCPNGFQVSNSDGVVQGHKKDKLEVTIMSVEPRVLKAGEEFEVTVRLKNAGHTKLFIPWQTIDDPRPEPKDPSGIEREDTGYFTLSLGTGDNQEIGTSIVADTDLFGTPGEKSTYHLLSPREWMTFRIRAAVRCKWPGDSSLCKTFESDTNGALTISWTESLYTKKREKCSVNTGAYTRREAESKPFHVGVVADSSEKPKK
jgi:hypothetical protein